MNIRHFVGGQFFASAVLLGSMVTSSHAATLYVAKNGSNSISYSSAVAGNPLLTITKAIELAQSGDVIQVKPGTYNEQVNINKSNLTIKAALTGEANRPVIAPNNSGIWQAVYINGQSNVTLSGMAVDPTNANAECDGVQITGGSTSINITYNIVRNAGGGGIITYNPNVDASGPGGAPGGCDFITITGNEVYNCCFNSHWDSSGISLHGNTAANTNAGFHCTVQNNIIHHNISKYTWYNTDGTRKVHTDGNGIIIDLQGANGPYTIIQNNIVYRNGGRGIHVFKSSHVRAYNNICYKNGQDPDIGSVPSGELTAAYANDVLFAHNLVYTDGTMYGNKTGTAQGNATNINFRYNSYYKGSTSNVTVTNTGTNETYNSNPKFADAEGGKFNSLAGGVGIDSGGTQNYASNDIKGLLRPQGFQVDRGAYEYVASGSSAASSSTS